MDDNVKSIFYKPVKTDINEEQQFRKVREEMRELMIAYNERTNWKEEATDVIQVIITLLDNHTDEMFENLWNRHIIKMTNRDYTAREYTA